MLAAPASSCGGSGALVERADLFGVMISGLAVWIGAGQLHRVLAAQATFRQSGGGATFSLRGSSCVENNHPDLVGYCLTCVTSAADLNRPRDSGQATPLHIAVEKGHVDMVKLLIAKYHTTGASVDVAKNDEAQETPLLIASRNPSGVIVDQLLSAGASVDRASADDGMTPLYWAAEEGQSDVTSRLIKAGALLNKCRTDSGQTPLLAAALKGHVDVVKQLLKAGASLDACRSDNGQTPLLVAALKGHTEVTQLLIEAGANLDLKKTNGQTALYAAVTKDHVNVVSALVAAGADQSICKQWHDPFAGCAKNNEEP